MQVKYEVFQVTSSYSNAITTQRDWQFLENFQTDAVGQMGYKGPCSQWETITHSCVLCMSIYLHLCTWEIWNCIYINTCIISLLVSLSFLRVQYEATIR